MPNILIVEDDEALAQVLQERLTLKGHQVTVCLDARAAAELAAGLQPDLAILDYLMPGMTGTDLLAELRAAVATKSLPVILLSSQEALRVSASVPPDPRVRFLPKPVDHVQLEAAMHGLLDPEGWSASS